MIGNDFEFRAVEIVFCNVPPPIQLLIALIRLLNIWIHEDLKILKRMTLFSKRSHGVIQGMHLTRYFKAEPFDFFLEKFAFRPFNCEIVTI